uniref:Furin-1-like n=1 Tax=Phallusia mammillata TaxID=59560 RepID=A0A6F9DDD9_9ASCI|nr:furin-1-like [Phallusia mammillata]
MYIRTFLCLLQTAVPMKIDRKHKVARLSVFVLILNGILSSHAYQGFINEWAVEINGDKQTADEVAETHGFVNHGKILENTNFYLFSHPRLRKRSLSGSAEHHSKLITHEKVVWAEQQVAKVRRKRDLVHFTGDQGFNDPRWSQMWYLLPSKQPSMRVVEAWEAGYSGKGVAVTILDDGIEYTHPDLKNNYDKHASGDINSKDDDPAPRLSPSNENRHGTRCAGEVAAAADNGVCSVGVAYHANIGGVRMLDGPVTDSVEAKSIGLNPQHVDIYSASWGPDDDGRTVDGPGPLAKKAFREGVHKGRQGKGSIFVWASGNGGKHADNCNCDGYTNSIYTLSISSTTSRKQKPWYSESCSSTLAATYSSGSIGEPQIVTTDLRHQCTSAHTGTSASAPLAAAICSLALEANGNLTWRDMQHLVVRTAKWEGLNVEDWLYNGVGHKVSHAFGFGLMDALAMVKQAENWTLVPAQRNCTIHVISPSQTPRIIDSTKILQVPVLASTCSDGSPMIEKLEHVQASLTLRNQRRGSLAIFLVSPMGTRSQLLGQRRMDTSKQGFDKWPFMTTHSWDEDPRGKWTLEINDHNQNAVKGTLSGFDLVFHGTLLSDWPSHEGHTASNQPKGSTSNPQHEKPMGGDSSSTTSTTEKSVITPAVTTSNCKRPLSNGQGCMVCESGFVLMPMLHSCVAHCPSGHYAAQETADGSEVEAEKSDGLVCRPCAANCHSCIGKEPKHCVQCVAGATMPQGSSKCVLPVVPTAPVSHFYLVLVFAILLLICFGLTIYAVINKQRRQSCFGRSEQKYKYVPSGDGAITRLYSDSGLTEYHDEEDHEYSDTQGRVSNGHLPATHVNGYANSAYSRDKPTGNGGLL